MTCPFSGKPTNQNARVTWITIQALPCRPIRSTHSRVVVITEDGVPDGVRSGCLFSSGGPAPHIRQGSNRKERQGIREMGESLRLPLACLKVGVVDAVIINKLKIEALFQNAIHFPHSVNPFIIRRPFLLDSNTKTMCYTV